MYDLKPTEGKMRKVADFFVEDLKTIRTGRATTALVEDLTVEYYGTQTPLKALASLTAPDPTSILIHPFDRNALSSIEAAIQESSQGFNPVNEGTSIRIIIPPLTQERRAELSKLVHQKAEEARIALRTVRKEAWDEAQRQEKAGSLTQDDRYRTEEALNKLIERYNGVIDAAAKIKASEIATI